MKLNPQELREIAIQKVIEQAPQMKKLVSIIVFGSVARGEADRRSDIDLLLVFDVPHDPEKGVEAKEVRRVVNSVERELVQFAGKGDELRIQPVLARLKKIVETELYKRIAREGKPVWGMPIVVKAGALNLQPHVIFTYSLQKLSPADKNRVNRALAGRSTRKEYRGKEYYSKQQGLLELCEAKKIGQGAILVHETKVRPFEEVFERFGVDYKKHEIWK